MRLLFSAAAFCVAAATPAFAQSDEQAQAAAKALQNPLVQELVAGMVDNLAGAVLDTQVGPLARYAPRDADIRPNDTLRDVQRRRDPGFEQRLHANARQAVATAGVVAEDAIAMQQSLQQTSDRLRAALAPLRAALAPK